MSNIDASPDFVYVHNLLVKLFILLTKFFSLFLDFGLIIFVKGEVC